MNKLRLRINGPKQQSLTLVRSHGLGPGALQPWAVRQEGGPLPCGGGIFELCLINIHLRAAEGVPPGTALFLWNPVVSRGDNLVGDERTFHSHPQVPGFPEGLPLFFLCILDPRDVVGVVASMPFNNILSWRDAEKPSCVCKCAPRHRAALCPRESS